MEYPTAVTSYMISLNYNNKVFNLFERNTALN